MKNLKVILVVTSVLLSFLIFQVNCAKVDNLTPEYTKLRAELETKMEAVKSREDYQKFQEDRKTKIEALLAKAEAAKGPDSVLLLKAKLLFDLRKLKDSSAVIDGLIAKNSELTNAAKFEKVRILNRNNKIQEAITLFKELETVVPKTDDYITVMVEFGFSAPNSADKMEYARKAIQAIGDKTKFERYKCFMYENLASFEKGNNNIDKAVALLEEALGTIKDNRNKESLQSTIDQYKMINQAPPAITAKNWENSRRPLRLSRLKGQVVVIDFWAPWCAPCRKVIPTLVKVYNELKDQGLTVIGYTRLYGRYSDDVPANRKDKVEPEEEIKLINDYLTRHGLEYPIAIADNDEIFKQYHVSGIPTMVIINKEGQISDIKVGSGDEKALEEKIRQLVGPVTE